MKFSARTMVSTFNGHLTFSIIGLLVLLRVKSSLIVQKSQIYLIHFLTTTWEPVIALC